MVVDDRKRKASTCLELGSVSSNMAVVFVLKDDEAVNTMCVSVASRARWCCTKWASILRLRSWSSSLRIKVALFASAFTSQQRRREETSTMDHRMWIIGDPLGARCPDVYCAIKNLRTVIGRLDLLRFAREKNRRAYTSRRANFRRRNFFPSGLRPAKKFNLYERRFPVQLVRCFLEQGETICFVETLLSSRNILTN